MHTMLIYSNLGQLVIFVVGQKVNWIEQHFTCHIEQRVTNLVNFTIPNPYNFPIAIQSYIIGLRSKGASVKHGFQHVPDKLESSTRQWSQFDYCPLVE